jgi:hypothetical protein
MDGLHDPAQLLFHPREKCPSVMAIAPNELHPGKSPFQWRQQGSSSFMVRFLGTCHFQYIALRINERMTLASPGFFPHILAFFWTTHRTRFDGWVGDDGGTWLRISALFDAYT